MRLAALQAPAASGDMSYAFDTLTWALNAAGAAGADMLTAPEVWLPGYNSDDIANLAQSRDGAWARDFGQLCAKARCGLTVGYAERDGEALFNSAITFNVFGQVIAHYRKIQLYGAREAGLYQRGQAYEIFEFQGQKVALLICYDIEFAPHVAALAAQGVTLILVPTANMEPFTHVVRHTVAAMAAGHGVAIVYANFCGQDGDLTYVGGTLIAARDGAILAQAGTATALIIADLPDLGAGALSSQAVDFKAIV
jgi:predicted amidohydrolase